LKLINFRKLLLKSLKNSLNILLPSESIMSHPKSHFGRYGKGQCLLNDPWTVGLLQLIPVWHVGCESEQT